MRRATILPSIPYILTILFGVWTLFGYYFDNTTWQLNSIAHWTELQSLQLQNCLSSYQNTIRDYRKSEYYPLLSRKSKTFLTANISCGASRWFIFIHQVAIEWNWENFTQNSVSLHWHLYNQISEYIHIKKLLSKFIRINMMSETKSFGLWIQ